MTTHQEHLLDIVQELPDASVEVGIRDHLVVIAYGEVVGQGSKNVNAHGATYDTNAKRLHPWRTVLTAAARNAIAEMYGEGQALPLFGAGTPVHVDLVLTFDRPKSHYGSGRNACLIKASAPMEPICAPDIDKAQRAILDAFTYAGVWKDDKQVSCVTARRVYPGPLRDALHVPGVVARIRAVPR